MPAHVWSSMVSTARQQAYLMQLLPAAVLDAAAASTPADGSSVSPATASSLPVTGPSDAGSH